MAVQEVSRGERMTHDELLALLSAKSNSDEIHALWAVVELHKPIIHALPDETCWACQDLYPCPTIQTIKKELNG